MNEETEAPIPPLPEGAPVTQERWEHLIRTSRERRAAESEIAAESVAEELADAEAAGAIGYMARILVQATLPHSRQAGSEFVRSNGALTVSVLTPERVGLPYGSIPRLLLAWVTTEAVRTRQRELVLGASLSQFLAKLDLGRRGGERGDITRLRRQMRSLFSSTISAIYLSDERDSIENMVLADRALLWWDPKRPDAPVLWDSVLQLSERFFEEAVSRPVPLDMLTLRALARSPLALDLYAWLTYRTATLKRPTTIPWASLELQFGADYTRTRIFKARFTMALGKVAALYPEARAEPGRAGLLIRPSSPHVPRLR